MCGHTGIAEFVREKYGDSPHTASFCQLLIRYTNYRAQLGVPAGALTKRQMAWVIGQYHCVSLETFYHIKTLLAAYFSWLKDRGLLEPGADNLLNGIRYQDLDFSDWYAERYFASFFELQSSLEEAVSLFLPEHDAGEFDTLTAALYLAWLGVDIEQACRVRLADIDWRGGSILLPDGGAAALEEDSLDFFQQYASSRGYSRAIRTVVFMPYKGSFLLRSIKVEQLTPANLKCMLTRFNQKAEQTGKRFTYDKVYWSGAFFRAMEYEQNVAPLNSGDTAQLERVFCERYGDRYKAARRFEEYEKYRSFRRGWNRQ